MTKTLRMLSVALALVGFALSAHAGEQGHREKGAGETTTIQGCLADGPQDGWYVLAKKKGEETKQIRVQGDASFEGHLGHEVKLTGSWVGEGDGKHFHATAMEHVAATCG